MTTPLPELWGIEDLAEALGITVQTAYVWNHREKFPEPDTRVSGRPIWRATRMRKWIEAGAQGTPRTLVLD